MEQRRGAMDPMGVNFWRDRPVLITGATGLVGSWLTRRLVEAGADVVALVRDWVPQSELIRSRIIERVKVVRGDVCDLGALERALGASVVDRARSGVILTAVGEEALRRATVILNEAEELVETAKNAGQPLTGRFRLGVIPTIAPFLLPRALPLLRQRFPKLRLFLREDLTQRLIAQLKAGQLDAALIALPFETHGLDWAHVADDELLARVGLTAHAGKYPCNCPVARNSVSALRAHWPTGRRSCCATRRPVRSIRRPPLRYWICWPRSIANSSSPSC